MMEVNFWIIPVAALIPLVTGFIWYSKALFGNAWQKSTDLREEQMKSGHMALTFILTYVLSLLIAMGLMPLVIHQFGIYSVLQGEPSIQDPASPLSLYVQEFMDKYGRNFRTFKHGAFHGVLTAIFMALPIIGILALFERKSFKYVAIHTGYWIITLGLMGGVICAFL